MSTTAFLVNTLPPCMLPKLKFIVTALGGAASSVLAVYPGVDHRVVIASAVLTAIGTYLTPNVQPVKLVGTVSTQAEAETKWITYGDDHPANPALVTTTVPWSEPLPRAEAATSTPVTEAPAAAPAVHEIGV